MPFYLFAPKLNGSITVAVTGSSAVTSIPLGTGVLRIANTGATVCYVEIGTGTPVAAVATSVPIQAGAVEWFSGLTAVAFSVATISGTTGTLIISRGDIL